MAQGRSGEPKDQRSKELAGANSVSGTGVAVKRAYSGVLGTRDTVLRMNPKELGPKELRRLMAELLRSDPDFEAFCLNHFPDIQRRFGRAMERTEKENLLLLHASQQAEIWAALRKDYPESAVWQSFPPAIRTDVKSPAEWTRFPTWLGFMAGLGVLLGVGLIWSSAHRARGLPVLGMRTPASGTCGGLAIDDVFLLKGTSQDGTGGPLSLDVRLRHGEKDAGPINITRATLDCANKTPERSSYGPSASYDLLIHGERNEAALAQRLAPGEIDRILIRLGFSDEAAAYQYSATLRLSYNGTCFAESAPFTLSPSAALWPAQVPPLR